jgi:GNAT superfamily N-acetyltransferase
VGENEWQIVAWLWQCFRHDLALIVSGLPYADGRYQASDLPTGSTDDAAGYLAWRPHPKSGEAAPVGFTLVRGLMGDRRDLTALWVSPVLRGQGVGRMLALTAFEEHPGPWSVVFSEDNIGAGHFWRQMADESFGPGGWTEDARPVPHVPGAPPDHWIETPARSRT